MKKLRNFYLILGLFAIAFAFVAKHIPGVTITDFVLGFCHGLGITAIIAGIVTAAIPHLYRTPKKEKETPTDNDQQDPHDPKTPAAPRFSTPYSSSGHEPRK